MPKLDQPTVGEPTVAAPVIEDKPAPVWDPKDSGLPGKRKKKP